MISLRRFTTGFSLLEVVLAIGLCGAVMALLTTAIDLYLVRVDTSRHQVETAQLARALLNEIADDLRAARYESGDTSGSSLGPQGSQLSNGSSLSAGAGTTRGIFGTLTELRIDRSAKRSWRQVSIPSTQVIADADVQAMPQTVEYFFVEGRVMPSAEFAAGGVTVDASLEGYTGLYRRQTPTSATTLASPTTANASASQGVAELLAPEVVQLSFMYSDGTQWYEQWDSSAQQGLPVAVEIKLSLFSDVLTDRPTARNLDEETRRRDPNRWVEHRLLVRILPLDEPQSLSGPASLGSDGQSS